MPHQAIKNIQVEQQIFAARIMVAGLLVVLALGIVAWRLIDLQILSYEHFNTLSRDNRVRLTAVPPPRGLIFDRHGVVLADNLPMYSLEIVPEQVKDMAHTLEELGKVLPLRESDLRQFKRALRSKRGFQSVPLRYNLSEEDVARFAVNRHRFPGVDIEARLSRYYPLGSSMSHVLGYVGRIDERELSRLDRNDYSGTSHIGKLGIEKRYEAELHGSPGVERIEVNAQGRRLRVLEREATTPGKNLFLNLDAALQAEAEKAMVGYKGAVVIMDPRDGGILALLSLPGYDPNLFVNGISSKNYRRLNKDPRRPLFNRALQGQYPPGSTIKPLVGLAGLEHNVITAQKTMFAGPYYRLPNDDHKYRDWKKTGHGKVDLDKAITQSSDVYFYDLAYKLGIDRIHSFLNQFLLGQRTGLDSTSEARGLLPSRGWKRRVKKEPWFPGETLIVGIGQGYMLATPLQLAVSTTILANQGKVFAPRLLHRLGRSLPEENPLLNQIQLRDEAHWQQVIAPMTHVMHKRNGTAYSKAGKGAKYTIAGKTGTSQVFSLRQDEEYDETKIAKKLRDHSLFVAFAPVDDPRIVITVIAENGGSGSRVAAPIARHLMDFYLLELGNLPQLEVDEIAEAQRDE